MNALIESQIVMPNNNLDWFRFEESLAQGNLMPVIGPDTLLIEISDSSAPELAFFG
jgi:hypothetical protein